MNKKFIDDIRLESKLVTSVELSQKKSRPESILVGFNLELNDNKVAEVLKDKIHAYSMTIGVDMYDVEDIDTEEDKPSPEEISLTCYATIEVKFKAKKKLKFDKAISEKYLSELISLVYDDLRFVIEENISRTEYKGFYLPVDFRTLLLR